MSGADLVEKRKPLTRRETIELAVRQAGKCGCGCGVKLDALREGVIDEHLIPLELTGPNDLRNRSLYRKPCAVKKTEKDSADIAKAKRLAGETCQGETRRPLQSRGFDKTMSRGFDGKVKPRRQKGAAFNFRASMRDDGTVRDAIKSFVPATITSDGRDDHNSIQPAARTARSET